MEVIGLMISTSFQDFHEFSNFHDFHDFHEILIMHHLKTETPQNIKNPHIVCINDRISVNWHWNVITLVIQQGWMP